jgi:hypothetical protein
VEGCCESGNETWGSATRDLVDKRKPSLTYLDNPDFTFSLVIISVNGRNQMRNEDLPVHKHSLKILVFKIWTRRLIGWDEVRQGVLSTTCSNHRLKEGERRWLDVTLSVSFLSARGNPSAELSFVKTKNLLSHDQRARYILMTPLNLSNPI